MGTEHSPGNTSSLTPPGKTPTEHRVDQFLGNLLRVGVVIAAAVAILGGVGYLMANGHHTVDFRVFQGEPAHLTSVGSIVAAALAGRSDALVQLGLVLLIATPVARVAMSLVAFALQRDRMYVLITAIVLALLTFSLVGGHG